MMSMFYTLFQPHRYTFAVTGLKRCRRYDKTFATRDEANLYMYKVINKLNLRINECYDDKHNKTYLCTNGVRFYINRM